MLQTTILAMPVLSYIGPGGALTFLGAAIALLMAVALAFFGFLWYPLKRLIRRRRTPAAQLIEHAPPEPRA